MEQDDTFTSIAKTDFAIKIICGFIFSIIGFIGTLIGMIVSFVNAKPDVGGIMIALMLAFLSLGIIDGYFLFRKGKKKTTTKQEK